MISLVGKGDPLASDRAPALESRPSGVSRQPALSSRPDALSLLKALRRRWRLAIILGLLVATTLGAATWYFVPRAKYIAKSTLLVATAPRRIIFEPKEGIADYRTYQRTQLALIKNRKVLMHALRSPDVARLPTILEKADPDEWLEQQLNVEFTGGAEVLQISLSGERAEDVTTIVNRVVQSYLSEVVAQEFQERKERLEALQKLWKKYQGDLEAKRIGLKTLAAAAGANPAAIGVEQQIHGEELATARRELLLARTELRRAQSGLAVILDGPGAEAQSAPESIEDQVDRHPDVQELRARIEQHRTRYNRLLGTVRDKADPSLTNIAAQHDVAKRALKSLEDRLRRSLADRPKAERVAISPDLAAARGQIDTWRAYQDLLTQDIARLTAETQKVGEKGLDLEAQRDEIVIASDVAHKVGAEVEASKVELDAPQRITILAEAKVPVKKDELRQIKAGGAAMIGSFFAVLLCVSLWEHRAGRIDAIEEVVDRLGMRLVGTLPVLPRTAGDDADSLKSQRRQSALVESIDATRTMLLHASRVESVRVVMIASAVEGEGKTALACQLGISLARSGLRTLLLDADLRHASAHRIFDLPASPGLSEVLRGESTVAETVRPTFATGLYFIPAGRCDSMALQALARHDLENIFELLKSEYDFVIVDSAPLLAVADSLLIGQNVDAVIYSILREVSRVPLVDAAVRRMEHLGVKTLGAVVNGVHSKNYSYGSYGSYEIQARDASLG
jgi:succinoglycan biosynthesis transport protein ExoP